MSPTNPAFPKIAYIAAADSQKDQPVIYETTGINVRAYIATKVLAGLLANPSPSFSRLEDQSKGLEMIARASVAMADALITELSK